MGIEFEKLTRQIAVMGQELAARRLNIEEQTELAGDFLMNLNDLDVIWERIMLARARDAGFRGAGPLDEPINMPFALPDCPRLGTILASDGSQIYPDPHGSLLYWLLNIGVFIYYHGADTLPEVITEPLLYFRDEEVRDSDGVPIPNAAINARRAVAEMQMLAREAFQRRTSAKPLLAVYDGPLLTFTTGKEVVNAAALSDSYHEALDMLYNMKALTAGYIDRPSSRFMVYTLYLMSLEEAEVKRGALATTGSLERLTDFDLYRVLLGPGDRSALMVQQSPQNKEYREAYGDDHEIAFFYVNVANTFQAPYLARVELPMAIAKHKPLVDTVHAMLYNQCQITDRYPYALTRADEIAVVHPFEKRALDDLIAVEMLRHHQSVATSQKLSMKGVARHGRQSFKSL